MITNDELSKALYESWETQHQKGSDYPSLEWEYLPPELKRCWSAVADTAWELIESENTIWAAESDRRAEDLAGLLVEFVNRAEDILA